MNRHRQLSVLVNIVVVISGGFLLVSCAGAHDIPLTPSSNFPPTFTPRPPTLTPTPIPYLPPTSTPDPRLEVTLSRGEEITLRHLVTGEVLHLYNLGEYFLIDQIPGGLQLEFETNFDGEARRWQSRQAFGAPFVPLGDDDFVIFPDILSYAYSEDFSLSLKLDRRVWEIFRE